MSRPASLSLWAAGAWAVLAAILLLVPPAADGAGASFLWQLLESVPWVDKLGHGAIFFVQSFLLATSLDRAGRRRPGLWAALLASLYGAALDLAQAFVPGRAPEGADIAANALGATLAAIIGGSVQKRSGPGESVP